MRLYRLQYSEHEGAPQEWCLEGMELQARNLLVGKNATGKSRTLNIIAGMAAHLMGGPLSLYGTWSMQFRGADGTEVEYNIRLADARVLSERFAIDGEVQLERSEGGVGKIKAKELQAFMSFQAPDNQLAAVVRRDAIQHPFLELLHQWASNLRHYRFGSELGKSHLNIAQAGEALPDERNQEFVVALFRLAMQRYGGSFHDAVLQDMACVGFPLERIEVAPPVSVRIQGVPGVPLGLVVKECGLPGLTDQFSMSQGMFRLLSLLIQVNYFCKNNTEATVVIDDVGEGLDFDRSCRLIKLLRQKSSASNLQLIMSSNDHFVMNEVPLDEWTVLVRSGGIVHVKNVLNSRDEFEAFKFTGLSNFSFFELSMDAPEGLSCA